MKKLMSLLLALVMVVSVLPGTALAAPLLIAPAPGAPIETYYLANTPALNGAKHNFKDVPTNQWFNNAVTWGSNKGVVSGYGGGVFKPNDAVSLEQVAVILHNYAGKPAGNGDISAFGACSDWAQPALKWAVDQGLFKGMEYGSVTASATRAQAAQMLMNYLSK